MPYDIQPVCAPRMTGLTLRLFTRLTERPLVGRAIRTHLKSQIGISRLRTVPIHEEVPADLKLRRRLENVADTPLESDHPVRVSNEAASFRGGPHAEGFQFTTIADYALAYREGEATPLDVAQRVIDATKASEAGDPAMRETRSGPAGAETGAEAETGVVGRSPARDTGTLTRSACPGEILYLPQEGASRVCGLAGRRGGCRP